MKCPEPEKRSLPSLTIVMPCLNEEASLREAACSGLRALDRYGIDGELIIINDGSTDGTMEVASTIARENRRVRVFSHTSPRGVGASFWHGVKESTKDFVTLFPGDNENDAEDALTYFYLTRDVDIIVPFIHNIEVRSVARRMISSLFRLIVNVSFGTNLNYTNGTVIYNSAILEDFELRSTGFFYQAELLIRLIRAGYLYAETPHFLSRRASGNTKALTWKSFREVMLSYLRLAWDAHVLHRVLSLNHNLNPKSATFRRSRGMTESVS